jgi:hypothetical protein
MATALTHVVQRLKRGGWTIAHVSPDALIVEGRSMGCFRVRARRGPLVVWVDGRKPCADGTHPHGQDLLDFQLLRYHARCSRRVAAEGALLLVTVADGDRSGAELEAARPAFTDSSGETQEMLRSIYSERGWTIDEARSHERDDGWDPPSWTIEATRAGDVLEVGFVSSHGALGDAGVVKTDDVGDAHVRTGSLYGQASVYTRTEAETVLALF